MTTSDETRRSVTLSSEAIKRFEDIYPMHGALTWFLNEALRQFVTLHEITPTDIVESSVRATLNHSPSEESQGDVE